MNNFKADYLAINDLEIYYHRNQDISGNKPPILLLHGFTDNGKCWARVANDLHEQYDVIMPDARGHGRTQGSLENFSYNQLGEDVVAFIKGLNIAKPFLFGHSMGGLTALIAAAKAPDLIRGIIMEDPPFWGKGHSATVKAENLEKEIEGAKAFQNKPLAEKITAIADSNPHWSEEENIPWAESKGEYNIELLYPAQRLGMHQYPWREAAAQANCPALLLTAGNGIVKPPVAKEAAKLISDCQVVNIAAAGHCIHRDVYEETMKPVITFLATH